MDYAAVLAEIEQLWGFEMHTPEAEKLDVPMSLVPLGPRPVDRIVAGAIIVTIVR
jgi:hypothetical protein